MIRYALVLAFALPAALLATAASAQTAAGTWDGTATIGPTTLPMKVVLTEAGGAFTATFDSPAQGATGLRLEQVRVDGAKTHFELPAGATRAIFDGQIAGDTMTGTFEQGPAKGTFTLKRVVVPATAAAPAPPKPYAEEEVKIQGKGVTLGGTLSLPRTPGPHPAVVLITGSGAQNRDEEILAFKIFGLVADRLTRDGFAVLRCDDRGIGASTGNTMQSTSADFADDVEAELAFLKTRADIDPRKIGLFGHSEGGLVGPMVAARSKDVAFVVMMSGPVLRGEELMVLQGEALARVGQTPPDILAKNRDLQKRLFAATRSGTGWDEIEKDARVQTRATFEALPEETRKTIPNMDAAVEMNVRTQIMMAKSPWLKFFIDYDPAPALQQLTCPLLVLFGEKDLQVPTDANRAALDRLLPKMATKDVTIKVIPNANHLYQAAKTGGASEYGTLPKEFAPGFLDTVSAWIKRKAM